jgi:hypothetical protein
MIYFIRAGQSNWIKVGYARDPHARLAVLQIGNHELCTIEATIEGGVSEEHRLHGICDSARRGEWFELTGLTLLAFNLAKAGKSTSEIFAELRRQQQITRAINDERAARGAVALRKRMADDEAVPIFQRRWLRMFGVKEAEREAEEERKRLIRRLAELEGV